MSCSHCLQKTALHWAAFRGDTGICTQLLDNGASLNATDKEGNTPAAVANLNNQKMLARYFKRCSLHCYTPTPHALHTHTSMHTKHRRVRVVAHALPRSPYHALTSVAT